MLENWFCIDPPYHLPRPDGSFLQMSATSVHKWPWLNNSLAGLFLQYTKHSSISGIGSCALKAFLVAFKVGAVHKKSSPGQFFYLENCYKLLIKKGCQHFIRFQSICFDCLEGMFFKKWLKKLLQNFNG